MEYLPQDRDEQKKHKLSINDLLALERTSMANERTFLAYIRTSLTLIVPGVTGVQLADSMLLKIVSFLFVPIGVILFIIGAGRFYKKRKINHFLKESASYPDKDQNKTGQ